MSTIDTSIVYQSGGIDYTFSIDGQGFDLYGNPVTGVTYGFNPLPPQPDGEPIYYLPGYMIPTMPALEQIQVQQVQQVQSVEPLVEVPEPYFPYVLGAIVVVALIIRWFNYDRH